MSFLKHSQFLLLRRISTEKASQFIILSESTSQWENPLQMENIFFM